MFAREASGARQRIRNAGFPAPKTLEDCDFAVQPAAEKPLITHVAQLAWIDEAANVCFLGPHRQEPARDRVGIKACRHGHRTLYATARQEVDRLEGAQHRNSLDDELRRLDRYRLLVIDEIGYLPLERQAANLLFALIARRYDAARSSAPRAAASSPAARARRRHGRRRAHRSLVHHATTITLKGKSYRPHERTAPSTNKPQPRARSKELS